VSLESSKTLGGIGAILLAIPFLSLVGIVLVLIAMKGVSEYYEDEGIFKNALYGFVFGFIGVIALVIFIVLFVVGFATISPIPVAIPYAGFAFVIVVLIVQYVFSIISAIFYKRSLESLATKSKENIFSTSGVILVVGAIIPIIGEILKFISWILAAVGFFSIKELKQTPTESEPTVDSEKRFCTNCGALLKPDSIYCQKCGKKIE
jgi:uncharacterized membrane protein